MKRISIVTVLAYVSLLVTAHPADNPAGSRDDAIAALAGKQTESKLLQAELTAKTGQLGSAKAEVKRLHDEGVVLSADDSPMNWGKIIGLTGNASRSGAAEKHAELLDSRIKEINARLKQLEGEIAQAKNNLDRASASTGKDSTRDGLRPQTQNTPRSSLPRTSVSDKCGKH